MKIKWQAEDGYIGKDRPQSTTISDKEILECASVEDAMDFIRDYIQSDFENKVSPGYDDEKIRREVEALFADKKEDA